MMWSVPFSLAVLIAVAVLPVQACEEAYASVAAQNAGDEAVAEVATAEEEKQQEELNMEQLIERLKKSDAIGFITKLAIRSDVMDFKERVDGYKKRKELDKRCEELRSHFDGLLLKIMALLERDPQLAKEIYLAKERIWDSIVGAEA